MIAARPRLRVPQPCRRSILSKDLVDRCHAKGIKVFSDALGFHETIDDYLRAMEIGVDLIQTDFPERVLRAIELRNKNESKS